MGIGIQRQQGRLAVLSLVAVAAWAVGCSDDKASGLSPTMSQASAAVPAKNMASASASPVAAAGSSAKLKVASGKASFLIDAPLEKIKGSSEDLDGSIDLDSADLSKSRGVVKVKLSSLKTTTFEDKDKNESQTEHAHNWMEASKNEYMWTTFTIESIETTVKAVAALPEENGVRTAKVKANGTLDLHGKKSPKSVSLTLSFKGPADHPELSVKSDEPMSVSLKEHGVMPRDTIGKFLDGALEKVGKKIDDKVQVSIDLSAKS